MTAVLKGVIFDMDGVIIESEYTHYRAICHAMGSQLAVSYDTFVEKCTGADERFAMGRMAELSGIDYDEVLLQQWSRKKADAYRQLVSTEAKAMPGCDGLSGIHRQPFSYCPCDWFEKVGCGCRGLKHSLRDGFPNYSIRLSPQVMSNGPSQIPRPIKMQWMGWACLPKIVWRLRIPPMVSGLPRVLVYECLAYLPCMVRSL